jgi:hypothetical protein
MKTTKTSLNNSPFLFLLILLLFPLPKVNALGPPGAPPPPEWLNFWSFNNTNSWISERTNAPVSFTNVAVSLLGNGYSPFLDSMNPAWLQYNVYETARRISPWPFPAEAWRGQSSSTARAANTAANLIMPSLGDEPRFPPFDSEGET